MRDFTSAQTIELGQRRGILSQKIPRFLQKPEHPSVLWRRYERQKDKLAQEDLSPREFHLNITYARANIPRKFWNVTEAPSFLTSFLDKLPEKVASSTGSTFIGSTNNIQQLALVARSALEQGFLSFLIDLADLLYLVGRSRSEADLREELDWLFGLEVLVIYNIPLQLSFQVNVQDLLGLLGGRQHAAYCSTILGVLATPDSPLLSKVQDDEVWTFNPLIAKFLDSPTIWCF